MRLGHTRHPIESSYWTTTRWLAKSFSMSYALDVMLHIIESTMRNVKNCFGKVHNMHTSYLAYLQLCLSLPLHRLLQVLLLSRFRLRSAGNYLGSSLLQNESGKEVGTDAVLLKLSSNKSWFMFTSSPDAIFTCKGERVCNKSPYTLCKFHITVKIRMNSYSWQYWAYMHAYWQWCEWY